MRLLPTAAILLLCAAGCAVTPPATPPSTAEAHADDVRAGAKLFQQHCAVCHGADATGTSRAPALRTASVREMPGEALVQFLADGDLRRGMPSWSRLPTERRWQLARYLRSMASTASADTPSAR